MKCESGAVFEERTVHGFGRCMVQLDNLTVMQFTGLLDKNGKDIYEGDIVRAWVDFGPAGEELRTFAVTLSPYGVNIQKFNFDSITSPKPEVLGNIYENPELVRGDTVPAGTFDDREVIERLASPVHDEEPNI